MDLLSPLNYWHWWILAVILAVAEVLIPGIYFLWVGGAAAVVGLLALAFPDLGWQWQVLAFGVLSMATAVVGRRVYKSTGGPTDHPTLNRRGLQYVGQIFPLDQAIVGGAGRVRIGDSSWKVSGADAPAGAWVRVVAADGVVLRVEPAEAATAEPAPKSAPTGR